MKFFKLIIAIGFIVLTGRLHAQAPFALELVKDINPSGDSYCGGFIELNGLIYFQANDGVHGWELWVTNGTATGTYMVKDINPNNSGGTGGLSRLQVLNGKLLFATNDGVHGAEWWVSDGTENGTKLLKDINPLPPSSFEGNALVGNIGVYHNELYFLANDGVHGLETWKTDGTTAGTQMVADLSPEPWSVDVLSKIVMPNGMAYKDKYYFMASDSVHGLELWVLDSTNAAPRMVKDIYPGVEDSNPYFLAVYNDVLLFRATDTNGAELWVTDGTSQGTQLMANIISGPNGAIDKGSFPAGAAVVFKDWLYFSIYPPNGGRGYLYRTKGVIGDPEEVELNSEPQWNTYGVGEFIYNEKLYFGGYTSTTGTELWRFNGDSYSDSLVIDIDTSIVSPFPGTLSSSPSHFFEFKEYLFFKAFNYDGYGNQLWVTNKNHDWFTYLKTDTNLIYDQSGYSDNSRIIIGDYVYFQGNYDGYGKELWRIRYDSTLLSVDAPQGFITQSLKVFPNPSNTNQIQLEFSLPQTEEYTIECYNLSGHKVLSLPKVKGNVGQNVNSMNIEDLSPGVYILKLQSETSFGQTKFLRM